MFYMTFLFAEAGEEDETDNKRNSASFHPQEEYMVTTAIVFIIATVMPQFTIYVLSDFVKYFCVFFIL